MKLSISDRSSFFGNLTTIGRITGKERIVKVRFVFYNGKFYVSRRTADGDWFKNILNNSSVVVEVNSEKIKGFAELVKDDLLSRQISKLKYRDKRREENRVVIEITPKR
ncbi:MAG: nitroreductase/quinone reductase family protein [Thermodesulfobacteriota bacterium]